MRGASGQLIMRVGQGRPAGPGRRLAVTEPIHYRAHRIPYTYSAEDFTLDVTSPGGTGSPGTLVVSLSLARISQATGRLTATMLAVSGLVVLAAGCLAAGMIRAMLQPLTELTRRAEAVAAGRPWSGGLPESPRGTPDQVAPALSATLARLEQAGAPSTGPRPATCGPLSASGRSSRTPAVSCARRSASWMAWPSTTGIATSSAPPASAACWPGSLRRPRGSARSSMPSNAPARTSPGHRVLTKMSAGVRNLRQA